MCFFVSLGEVTIAASHGRLGAESVEGASFSPSKGKPEGGYLNNGSAAPCWSTSEILPTTPSVDAALVVPY